MHVLLKHQLINMKNFFTGLILFSNFLSFAQSPYLSFILKMDSIKSSGIRYKIEMKICEPKKTTQIGNWFSHEVSKIKFDSLKASDIECGEWFDKGLPTLISGEEEKKPDNQFEFGNQHFAWEHIFIFRISNMSSRGWMPEMYVVMPMKYKSFYTRIKLTNLEFQSGKVLYLTKLNTSQEKSNLIINQSLKNYKTVDEKTFFLKEILEKD